MPGTRTHVTFSCSGFNTSEQRGYFINSNNFGDDLARWLMQKLRALKVEVDPELGQEDCGWYFTFRSGGQSYNFVLGHRDEEGAEWLGWLERSAGFLPPLLGARRRSVPPVPAQVIPYGLGFFA